MAARTFAVDGGGASRLVKRWALVDGGGTTRFAKRVFLIDAGGAARLVFNPIIVVTITPNQAASNPVFGPANATTNVVTASAVGGSGTYVSFVWTLSATSGPAITITNPNGFQTAFSAHLQAGSTAQALATCTVTDSGGMTGSQGCSVFLTTTN